jgi:AcrR family transcriptional regulator
VDQSGLRERKKARTRETISSTAIALFCRRGYDAVSVVEVAEAAEVSKRTLFAYFPTKDDLVLHRFADHADDTARAVRSRGAGESPLDALRLRRRDAIASRDPASGVVDHPEVVEFYRLVTTTPSLATGLAAYNRRTEAALAAALRDVDPGAGAIVAALAAAQVTAVERVLAASAQQRILAGARTDEVVPDALRETEQAYDLLESGMAPFA